MDGVYVPFRYIGGKHECDALSLFKILLELIKMHEMSDEINFPFIETYASKRCYGSLRELKKSGSPFPSNFDSLMNQSDIVGAGVRARVKGYLTSYFRVENEDTTAKAIDLLLEKLNPEEIVDKRWYSMGQAFAFLKLKLVADKVAKLIEEDGKIEMYWDGTYCCILGKDIPYMAELLKKNKHSDKRLKHQYLLIDEGTNYIPTDDFSHKAGLSPGKLRELLDEHEELRGDIYVTVTGRMMVKEEDVERLKESVRAILRQA